MQTKGIYCKNGDIYMADLPLDREGSLQSGYRPVIVVSNNFANAYSPVITVLPMTSKTGKKKLPTHVMIENCGLSRRSVALAEQIMSINKTQLREKMGSISATTYAEKLKKAMAIQLGL